MFNANEAKATAKEALTRIVKEQQEEERRKNAKIVDAAYANTKPVLDALSNLIRNVATAGKTSISLAISPYEGVRGLMQFNLDEEDTHFFCVYHLYEVQPEEFTRTHLRRVFVVGEVEKALLDAGYRIIKKRDKDATILTVKWGWRGRKPGQRA